LVFLRLFGIYDLLVSLSNNIFNLFLSETLEVIWHESVWSELRFGGGEILLHNITHIGSLNFRSILSLLILEPCGLSVSLLLSQHLIVLLHFFNHLLLPQGGLVLQNLSHLGNSSGLIGIVFFFLALILIVLIVLSFLLHHPFFLQLCICSFPGGVGYTSVKCNVR